jgi:hypothetical protein
MELRFDPRGKITIVAGTLSHGQGHETSYAQMVADWLGVPDDKIHLAQADTDEVAIDRGTYASRSMLLRARDHAFSLAAQPDRPGQLTGSSARCKWGNSRVTARCAAIQRCSVTTTHSVPTIRAG